jgi:hypothetical protein
MVVEIQGGFSWHLSTSLNLDNSRNFCGLNKKVNKLSGSKKYQKQDWT